MQRHFGKAIMKIGSGYYKSYLLRMWRESLEGEWRASLQDVVTCENHNFPNMAALMDYLAVENQKYENLKVHSESVFIES